MSLPKELIHFILLHLGDARLYYHTARQLCHYTRKLVPLHVDIRIINCWYEDAAESATFRSIVWKGLPHPHQVYKCHPYICYHGFGRYVINGKTWVRRKIVFFGQEFLRAYLVGYRSFHHFE